MTKTNIRIESEAIADWLSRMVDSVRGEDHELEPADAFLEMASRGAASVDRIMAAYNATHGGGSTESGDHARVALAAQQALCQAELVAAAGELIKTLSGLHGMLEQLMSIRNK